MNKTTIANHEQVVYQNKGKMIPEYKKNPLRAVDEIVRSVSGFLSVELDVISFDKYRRSFESDCQRAVSKIFIALFEKESPFLIFPDIVPGFTTLVYKKNAKAFLNKEAAKEIDAKVGATTGHAIDYLFNSLFEKNNQIVLMIESDELLMMFCPVTNVDKYFKDLHAYSNM